MDETLLIFVNWRELEYIYNYWPFVLFRLIMGCGANNCNETGFPLKFIRNW